MNRLILITSFFLGTQIFGACHDNYIPSLTGKIFANLATYQSFTFNPGIFRNCTTISTSDATRVMCNSVQGGSAQIGTPNEIRQGTVYFNQVTVVNSTTSANNLQCTYTFNGNFLETGTLYPRHSKIQLILTGIEQNGNIPSYQGTLALQDYGITNGIEVR